MSFKLGRIGSYLFCLSTATLLAGCAIEPPNDLGHDFSPELTQPRPRSVDQSKAMKKMYTEFSGYSYRELGCLMDTAIWEGEETTVKGGFDPMEVYESTIGWKYSKEDKQKHLAKLLDNHGTIPGVLKTKLDESNLNLELQFLSNNYTFSDLSKISNLASSSTQGWSTAGVLLSSAIYAVGLFNEALQEVYERFNVKNLTYYNLSYRLTADDLKTFPALGLDDLQTDEDYGKLAGVYEDRVLTAMRNAATKIGFAVSDESYMWKEDMGRAKIYFSLEGRNCPKANKAEPWKTCYIGLPVGRTKAKLPTYCFLSKNGANAASFVFDWRSDRKIYVPDLTPEQDRALFHEFVGQIMKDNPNFTLYYPAEEVNGVWEPQRVVDKDGTHYFTIPVKRQNSQVQNQI